MLDPVFHEAWVHRPGGHTILGRPLHPFCALDIVALEAIGSPFLTKGSTAHVPDLLLAVWILSHDHPRSCSIENLELGEEGKAWLEGIKKDIDLDRDASKLTAYIADYYATPEMMRDDTPEPMLPYGTPWILSNVMAVVKNLHVSLYDAWTMEAGKLLWYCSALEEATDPNSRIVGQELRERFKEAETTGVRSFKVEPGESLADLAKRVGCSEEQAGELLEQARTQTAQRTL